MNTKKTNNKISRREFSSRIARTGLGLAAAGIMPIVSGSSKHGKPAGKFIDVHHHLGKALMSDPEVFSFKPILDWMDANQVSRTVILSAVQYPESWFTYYGSTGISQDDLLEKFAETEGRLLPFCRIHPDAQSSTPEITKQLKRLKKKGVVGFGEIKPRNKEGEARNMPLDDPAMKRIYSACADIGFPVLLHIDNRHAVDVPGLPALERVLKEFPEVNFIGHANGWWNSITADVKEFKGYPTGKVVPGGAAARLIGEYPNMYADLSANSGLNAITRDKEFGMKFLVDHADKLMFGTDAQGGIGRESHFQFYNEACLPAEAQDKIFRDNALRLLNI